MVSEDGITASKKVCHSNCIVPFFLYLTPTSSMVVLNELIVAQLVKKLTALIKSKSKVKVKVSPVLD
jgi:hypothetical protein